MKIFIVEDEKNIREELYILLKAKANITVVGFAESVKDALEILPTIKVDLVLMDIELTDGKSFEIIEKLAQINFHIIFITAYHQFAIKAIKVGALDYILKPIDEQELYKALDNFSQKKENIKTEQKELLLEHIAEDKAVEKITIKTLSEIFFIKTKDIIYCQGQGNYTTFVLQNTEKIVSSRPLKEYTEILPKNNFLRIHQSYLVNKKCAKKYSNNELLLINNEKIPVSSRKKEMVIEELSK